MVNKTYPACKSAPGRAGVLGPANEVTASIPEVQHRRGNPTRRLFLSACGECLWLSDNHTGPQFWTRKHDCCYGSGSLWHSVASSGEVTVRVLEHKVHLTHDKLVTGVCLIPLEETST